MGSRVHPPKGIDSMKLTSRSISIFIRTAIVSLVSLAVVVPTASAGVLVSSATSCDAQTFEQPFVPWADVANYVIAPNGTFESGSSGWTLSGGASVVSGNESYNVHGAGESRSLALPSGASATSRSMCVGIEHPDLRIFARNGGSTLSTLKVDVLFEDAAGNTQSLTIGTLTGSASWQPSVVMPLVVNLLPLLPDERTAVAFRFTADSAAGSWRIDDVYVDPYRRY
jgi:hypothetical protein